MAQIATDAIISGDSSGVKQSATVILGALGEKLVLPQFAGDAIIPT
jgi:hypothetical protein